MPRNPKPVKPAKLPYTKRELRRWTLACLEDLIYFLELGGNERNRKDVARIWGRLKRGCCKRISAKSVSDRVDIGSNGYENK
jgi:hypothetical protein